MYSSYDVFMFRLFLSNDIVTIVLTIKYMFNTWDDKIKTKYCFKNAHKQFTNNKQRYKPYKNISIIYAAESYRVRI